MKRNVVGIRRAAILGALIAGAAIFTSCATAGKRVTVLTYNTHLFGGSNAEHAHKLEHVGEPIGDIGSAIKEKKVEPIFDEAKTAEIVFDDENRAESIAKKLETCGADIVALQELWSCDRPRWFAERLTKVYPHKFYYTEQCPEVTFVKFAWEVTREGTSQEAVKNQIKKKNYKLMNGLLLLSKYPIETAKFHEFPAGRTGDKKDQLARKGVITATIALPNGLRLRVGVTHATTDVGGWQSMPDIANLAEYSTEGADKIGPAIMMGDFNAHYYTANAAEYNRMSDIFARVGALDAYRQAKKRNDMTVNWAANPLLRYFFPEKQEPACIDYVFYRPSGPGLTIKPESAKVVTDWKYRVTNLYSRAIMKGKTRDVDLSDHYPVVATFSLWNGPNPITWVDPEPPRAR